MANIMSKLKLGVIGFSEGNGHPYSWSAIFNGFNRDEMKKCPFPVIIEYLERQTFPKDFLFDRATVTHIWTQDKKLSNIIALATFIPNICDTLDDMIKSVDAVLLARDDAENHKKFANSILKAGLPIYIDKPFALRVDDANHLWDLAKYHDQIFTCSALQFAKEFKYSNLDKDKIGDIKFIWGTTPKSWKKYGVHLIEPLLNLIPNRGELISVRSLKQKTNTPINIEIEWSKGIKAILQASGDLPSPIWFRVLGTKGYQDLYFNDTFYAFSSALTKFLDIIEGKEKNISRDFTKEMVEILEKGCNE
tara:strand:+ start:2724 stop:3641 length:918 start_codon:yes stop_codon:yes gene_type:complete